MVRVGLVLGVLFSFLLIGPAVSDASVITFTLGDRDGLGFGLVPGQQVPFTPFDNRGPGDPAFTDFGVSGETNAWFSFIYTPILGTINSANLEFGLMGIEDERNDSAQPDWDDRLFLDNVEIPGAFDTAYTGVLTYGIVYQGIPSNLFGLLADGTANFFFDGWPYGTSPTVRRGDQVSFDYVTMTIDYTSAPRLPAPATLILAVLGTAAIVVVKRLAV